MASSPYSFIDIVVMDEVRVRFAAGDALAILAVDLDSVIWANGPAAELFGFADIEAIMGARAGLGFAAKRQIAAAPGFPRIGRDRPALVRLASGMSSRAVPFLVSGVTMPDGEPAILLALPANAAGASAPDMVADRVIAGFREAGYFAALVGQDARVLAASNGFGALGLPAEVLAQLVHEVAGEQDRLIKRMVRADGGSIPAGIARLTDEPALHLLVVVDEREEAGETETGEAPAAGHAPPPEPPAPSDADIVEFIEEGAAAATFEASEDETARDRQSQPRETSSGVAPAPPAVPDDADADDWYFRDHGERRRGERRAQPPATSATPPPAAAAPAQVTALPTTPVRFVWRTDAEGAFSAISSEFASAVGPRAADVIGRRFRDVATVFGLDPSGEIADLLERRDTWSGRSVLWPIAGTDLKVPVDLAALPVYSRDRTFEGFRGFGVARMGDAIADPEALGLTLVSGAAAKVEPAPPSAPVDEAPHEDEDPTTEDPFRGETPVISIAGRRERRASDKIIRLAEHRPQVPEKTLSASERSALDEIRAKLRKDYETQRELERTQPGKLTEAGEPDTAEPKDAPERDEPSKPEAGRARGGEDLSFGSTDDGDQHPVAVGDEADEPVSDDLYDEPHLRALDDVTETAEPATDEDAAQPAPDDVAAPAAEAAPAHAPSIPLSGFTPSAFWSDSDGGVDADLVSGLPMPVLIHAGDELYFANREFLKLTGFASLNQIRREGGLDGLFAERADEDAARGPDGAKLRLRTLGGEEFPVDAHLQSIRWRGGSALLLALRRVAEVRQAPVRQQAPRSDFIGIEETETRVEEMRAIIDTATDGVVLIANDGTIRNISRPAEALFGFDSAAVEGKPFSSLFAIESQRAARDYLNGLSENGVASVLNDGREVIGREAEGRFIPLFMTIGRLPNDSGFCAVVRDITQWKRAEEELTQARSLAERSSSQKTEFLARVSHEIRTPLNAIIGFSELMIDEKFGPIGSDRYRDYLRDINRSGNHVLDLVNDLLDISKIEAGEQEMNYEAVSLNDTLAEAVAMMQPQANRDRVIIRSSLASRLPEVVADLRSVRQIALNLLSNAIRYTQAGGQVIVSTSYETSGDVTMRVRDTGVGMTLGEIDQALKPFKQINALRRGRRDGTGLGLPLTKAMVEANRARFSIASTPSEGTLVEITFPSTRVLAD